MRKRNAVGWYDKITDAQKALAKSIARKALRQIKQIKGVYNGMLLHHTSMSAMSAGIVTNNGCIARGYKPVVAFAFHLVVDGWHR